MDPGATLTRIALKHTKLQITLSCFFLLEKKGKCLHPTLDLTVYTCRNLIIHYMHSIITLELKCYFPPYIVFKVIFIVCLLFIKSNYMSG